MQKYLYFIIFAVLPFLCWSETAQQLLVSIKIESTNTFEVEGVGSVSIYGLRERNKPFFSAKRRMLEVAALEKGPLILTDNPRMAVQEICNQISKQLGGNWGRVFDSVFAAAIEPNILLLAFDEKTVMHILLIPEKENYYRVCITYVKDE